MYTVCDNHNSLKSILQRSSDADRTGNHALVRCRVAFCAIWYDMRWNGVDRKNLLTPWVKYDVWCYWTSKLVAMHSRLLEQDLTIMVCQNTSTTAALRRRPILTWGTNYLGRYLLAGVLQLHVHEKWCLSRRTCYIPLELSLAVTVLL